MSKLSICCFILTISYLSIATQIHEAASVDSTEAEPFYQNIGAGVKNLTKLHFYMQEFEDGPNQSVYEVANASITSSSSTNFGKVLVMDNFITAGPGLDTAELGRVQGQITYSDLKVLSLVMDLTIVFTSGVYKGSTLSILGRNPITEAVREFVVAGGTGIFRFARGYVVSSTYSNDGHHLVLEYTVYTTCSGVTEHESLPAADMWQIAEEFEEFLLLFV